MPSCVLLLEQHQALPCSDETQIYAVALNCDPRLWILIPPTCL